MRAREFIKESNTINIHITIPDGGGKPVISSGPPEDEDENGLQGDPIMVSPLQQELEIAKAYLGKDSNVLPKIMNDNGALSDHSDEEEEQSNDNRNY